MSDLSDLPLAKARGVINDRLGAANVSEALAPAFKHLIGCLGMETTDVDICLTANVLQSSVKGLQGRAGGWNCLRDGWLLVYKHVKAWRDAAVLSHLRQRHAIGSEDLSRRRGALRVHASWRTIDDCNSRDRMIGGIASV